MDLEEVLQRIVQTLKEGYDPEKIILFGSYARGEAGPDSDVDIMVIKDTEKRFVERCAEVSRMLWWVRARPLRLPLDILVETPGEVQARLALGDSFYREVVHGGRVLYERAA